MFLYFLVSLLLVLRYGANCDVNWTGIRAVGRPQIWQDEDEGRNLAPLNTCQTMAAIFDTPNESTFIARQKAVHESRSNPPLKRPL